MPFAEIEADYQRACRSYRKKPEVLDRALYELCRQYSDHKDPGGIRAKLWIIGRAYGTGIERQIKKTGKQGGALEKLSDHFWKKHRSVDSIMRPLRGLDKPLTVRKRDTILKAHGRLLKLIQPILRNKRVAPRSFVSKYLHFHCPAVPIFDSIANNELKKLMRSEDALALDRLSKFPKESDKAYGKYVQQFWKFHEWMHQNGAKVSVKLLDNYLLWRAS